MRYNHCEDDKDKRLIQCKLHDLATKNKKMARRIERHPLWISFSTTRGSWWSLYYPNSKSHKLSPMMELLTQWSMPKILELTRPSISCLVRLPTDRSLSHWRVAQGWFMGLLLSFIWNFEELAKLFIIQFMAIMKRRCPITIVKQWGPRA